MTDCFLPGRSCKDICDARMPIVISPWPHFGAGWAMFFTMCQVFLALQGEAGLRWVDKHLDPGVAPVFEMENDVL